MGKPASERAGVRGKVTTGARVHLQLGDKPVGYASVASYAESITYDAVAVLDQMEIAEHVPIAYDVSFTASRLYIMKKTLKDLRYMPKWPDGQSSDQLLIDIIALGEMNAEIIDQDPDIGTLVSLRGVRVTSHNITFGARALVGEDVAFVAIRAVDPSEAS